MNGPLRKTSNRLGRSAPAPYHHDRLVEVAIDSCADGLVAIKTGSNVPGIAAVEREALVLSQIAHPNVVELLRTERVGERSALITHFAGRTTLADHQPTSPEAVARIGAALLTIVGELHEMGWIHGRLAEQHCILGTDLDLTLCAFGAAHRVIGNDTRISIDDAHAVGIIGLLADRLGDQTDRRGRRSRRRLDGLLAGWRPDPSQPLEATRRLRDGLAAMAGDRPMLARPSRYDDHPTRPSSGRGTRSRVRPRWHAIGVAIGTLSGLLATIAVLRLLGGPVANPFRSPAVAELGVVPQPVAVALELIRVGAFLACLYGVALAATTLAAILTRNVELERAAEAMAPPFLRKAIVGLVGLGVLAGAIAPEPAVGPTVGPAVRPTVGPTTESPPAIVSTAAAPETIVPTVTGPTAPDPTPGDADLPTMWVIEPGDHLWKVAATTLARHLRRRPSTREVHEYWMAVIELNRASLIDRDNPDLIMVGQVIELPPIQ